MKYNETPEAFTKRASYQLSPEEKAKKATFVLHNNGTQQELKKQCQTLFNKLISKDLKP
jgi:dephospho-CoA kinase